MGGVGGYDQLCCRASSKLLLGLDLGLGCDNFCKPAPALAEHCTAPPPRVSIISPSTCSE